MRRAVQGILLALLAALLFGLVSVAARASALPPLVKGAYAYLLAGLLLAPTLRGLRVDERDWPKMLIMSLVGGALAPALLFYGLEQATAADASILLTLEMVFTALLATVFLRERAPVAAWVGIVMLFASALVIAYATSSRVGVTTLVGAALVALAALGWSVDNTVSTKLVGAYKPHHLIAIKGLVGGAAALLVAIALGNDLGLPRHEIRNVAYIGTLGIGASILLFYLALQRIGATITSSIFLPGTAIAGVLGAWLLLHEQLTPAHAFAASLALVGILLVSRQSSRENRPQVAGAEPDA